eukprot:3422252-Prorocentrum_lima.AAC.1
MCIRDSTASCLCKATTLASYGPLVERRLKPTRNNGTNEPSPRNLCSRPAGVPPSVGKAEGFYILHA